MDIGSNTVSCLNRRKNTKNIKKSKNTVDNHRNLWYKYSCDAEVAELADAQASGACGSNTVRVAKRNRKFYNSGVKIKTTTSGSAGTESDGGIRSEKDRRQEGE